MQTKFIATIRKSPRDNYKRYEININRDFSNITYDEVDFEVLKLLTRFYPSEYYPKSDYKIYIVDVDGEEYPVVSESDTKSIKKLEKSKEYEKFLILPDAVYNLTEEYRLYLNMINQGIISKTTKFEFEKYSNILKEMKNGK